MSDMKHAFFLLFAIIVGLVIDLSFISGTSMLHMEDSFTAVPNLSKSNKLSSRNSPGRVTVAAAAAPATANTTASSPSMPSSRTAAGDEIINNVTAAPWNYEDKAILAGQKIMDPSQTDVVIPAQNHFGYQQQPAIPSSSSNDGTNASISTQILRVGGPIGSLIILVNLIYWLFFKNNCPCSDASTAGETNFNCDISLSCCG